MGLSLNSISHLTSQEFDIPPKTEHASKRYYFPKSDSDDAGDGA